MTEIWNTSGLCRCCHAEGDFKGLNEYSNEISGDDCYVLLKDTFDIIVSYYSLRMKKIRNKYFP